jgi:hypothetical protein
MPSLILGQIEYDEKRQVAVYYPYIMSRSTDKLYCDVVTSLLTHVNYIIPNIISIFGDIMSNSTIIDHRIDNINQ